MATIRKRGDLQYEVRIRRKGYPTASKTFLKKKDAEAWASRVENEMHSGVYTPREASENTTLAEALERYREDIFPGLARGGYGLNANLNRLKAHLGAFSIANLDSSHIARYRDQQAKLRSAQTVVHDLNLLNRVLKICEMEWNIPLPRGLATARVRKPKLPQGRDRRLARDENNNCVEEAFLLETAEQFGAFGPSYRRLIVFALETAMRRNEILGMEWQHITFSSKVVFLPHTKMGIPRKVPLSERALQVLQEIGPQESGPVWLISKNEEMPKILSGNTVTQAFADICKVARIEDLTFHDLRHEAVSRLFEKGWNMAQVAAVSGHATYECLKRYTHLKAEDLVKFL